jgi:hypothetical protein
MRPKRTEDNVAEILTIYRDIERLIAQLVALKALPPSRRAAERIRVHERLRRLAASRLRALTLAGLC